MQLQLAGFAVVFQSTLPARGATAKLRFSQFAQSNFNPRSPHGERLLPPLPQRIYYISIHAPRTGSDGQLWFALSVRQISIHAPRTGSDLEIAVSKSERRISIHAPRTGSDQHISSRNFWHILISIHAPRTGSD